jgi:hypothetical protein
MFGFFFKRLPPHTQRALFMASYVVQSYRRNHDDVKAKDEKEILKKLDRIFDLCNEGNVNVMQMPDLVSKVIVKGVVIYDVNKPVSSDEATAMARDVTGQVPEWLRYEGIETDTAQLLQRMPSAA